MNLWKRFQNRYPNADMSKLKKRSFFGEETIMFEGENDIISVFDRDKFRSSTYFSDEMRSALRIPTGFPLELTLNPKPKFSIPAIPFSAETKPLSDVSNALVNQKIYVTPTDNFTCKCRDMFSHTQITQYSEKESVMALWTDMSCWGQQLNFAIFCSTTACGISNRLLFEEKMRDGVHDLTDDKLRLPNHIRSYFVVTSIMCRVPSV